MEEEKEGGNQKGTNLWYFPHCSQAEEALLLGALVPGAEIE